MEGTEFPAHGQTIPLLPLCREFGRKVLKLKIDVAGKTVELARVTCFLVKFTVGPDSPGNGIRRWVRETAPRPSHHAACRLRSEASNCFPGARGKHCVFSIARSTQLRVSPPGKSRHSAHRPDVGCATREI